MGVRLSKKGRIVERITIKIKVFESEKWEWQVRQIFSKKPQFSLQQFVKILDEIKQETMALEEKEKIVS